MTDYQLWIVRVGDDGTEQVVGRFPSEISQPLPVPLPLPQPTPDPEPQPDVPTIASVVLVPRLNIRSVPAVSGTVIDSVPAGTELFVKQEYRDLDGHRWREIVLGLKPEHRGMFVAEAVVNNGIIVERYLLLEKAGDPPVKPIPVPDPEPLPSQPAVSELVGGSMRLITKTHPELGDYTGIRNGPEIWGTWPKLMVNFRSGIVSRTPGLGQFMYQDQDLVLNEDEFEEHMDVFNNTVNAGLKYSINAAYVRVFVPHEQMLREGRQDELIDRLEWFLDECAARNMQAMLVWNDSLRTDVQHTYPREVEYHSLADGHLDETYWHRAIYEKEMAGFIAQALPRIANHPGLGMHQLWNEPHPNAGSDKETIAAFKRACMFMSRVIREIDEAHPISIGLINASKAAWPGASVRDAAEYLYGTEDGFLEHIHLHSCHMYALKDAQNHEQPWEQENIVAMELFEIAPKYGRVPIIDEGMTWANPDNIMLDPAVQMDMMLQRMYERGLHCFGIWGAAFFSRDTRHGGRDRAWDNQFNSSYFGLKDLFAQYGHNRLATIQ